MQEVLDLDFDGHGEHLYIYIRKCALNTTDVVESLQRQFRCRSVDIGVSGLKDKNAITDQWISIRTPMKLDDTSLHTALQRPSKNEPEHTELSIREGHFCVLEFHRHSRKLRRGAHKQNRFVITVRDIENTSHSASLSEAVDSRLSWLKINGFANYFGPQRFGIEHQNLLTAERLFANPNRKMSRTKRSLAISAARSYLFNSVCAERVRAENWNLPLNGEPLLLDGSNSFFINDSQSGSKDACKTNGTEYVHSGDIVERCRRHDIHPTGPLWGLGDSLATGECKQLETSNLQIYTSLRQGLEKTGLKQQRRALRANVRHLKWHWQDSSIVTLDFNMPKGVYATSFLSEFMIN